MGTPNSRTLLADLVRSGVMPSIEQLCQLGLDITLLADRYASIKPQLKYFDGHSLIEDTFEHEHRDATWRQLVAQAGLTGTRCFRFTELTPNSSKSESGIFTLMPWESGSFPDVEIFLLPRDGGVWLIWDEKSEGRPIFTYHGDVSQVVRHLDRIAGKEHFYHNSCRHCNSLEVWSSSETGRDQSTAAIALVLLAHLELIVAKSIQLKSDRLATQQELLDNLRAVDRRNALPSASTAD